MVTFDLHNLTVIVGYDTLILTESIPPCTQMTYNVHEDAKWLLNDLETYREDIILAVASATGKVRVTLSEPIVKNGFSTYYMQAELNIDMDD